MCAKYLIKINIIFGVVDEDNCKFAVCCLLTAVPANAEYEKLDLCNNCDSSTRTNTAIAASNSTDGYSHVVDIQNGTVDSYYVEHSYEPGFNYSIASPVASPTDLVAAVQEVHAFVHESVNRDAIYDVATNTLTSTYRVPASRATSASQLLNDYALSQKISNDLRLMFLSNFYSKFGAAWSAVILKMNIVVNVVFVDGSSAVYKLGPIFNSDHPYVLVFSSITGPNGQPLQTGSGGGEYAIIGTSTTSSGSGSSTIICNCELWQFPDGNGGYYVIQRNCTYSTMEP